MHTTWAEAASFPRLVRGNLSQSLANHLRREIVSGALRRGRKLPSNRRLADLCGVSLATVRQAMAHLDALGLIRVEHGVGTFVARGEANERRLLSVELRRASPIDIACLRPPLEGEAAARAAEHIAGSEQRRQSIGSMIAMWDGERFRERLGSPDRFTDADIALHRAIVTGAGPSDAFAGMFHARLMRRLRPWLLKAAPQLVGQRVNGLHADLVMAVLGDESQVARELAAEVAEREANAISEALR
jgi:DNA-binding FadR family transcriptional regulator